MANLLDTARSHWVLFLLMQGASLTLLFTANPYHHSVWWQGSVRAAAVASQASLSVSRLYQLPAENSALLARNAALEQTNAMLRARLRQAEAEPSPTERRVAELTGGMRLIAAQVCQSQPLSRDNVMLIDRGTDHGVRPEQGVLCATGVVGIVAQAGRRYSTVIPLLHRRSSISCRVRGTDYFGYLHWPGGNPLVATLDEIPHHARIKVGDKVETSGYSNVFPAGVFVGRVVKVAPSADGQSQTLTVHLATDLTAVTQVQVVDNTDVELMREAI